MAFCSKCGAQLVAGAAFCTSCGAPAGGFVPAPFGVGAGGGDGEDRSFIGSIKLCLRKYALFTGRAPRAEFWWWVLATVTIGGIIDAINLPTYISYFNAIEAYAQDPTLAQPVLFSPGIAVGDLFSLGILLPNLAVNVRRLHDTDRSGWWLLMFFVPLVGPILLLVWFCQRGTRGPNPYGTDPLPAFV
jgi:uncharacterized membrane protein YhaH (DUF805 family)